MITLQDATKTFRGEGGQKIEAVRRVSLEIPDGRTHALIGTSGCGKTTTLRLINRLETLSSGSIAVDGDNIERVDVIRLRRRLGYVIQSAGLFPHMTVAENVGLLCRLEDWEAARTRERVDELLEGVALDPNQFRDRRPSELSGGEQQRVGIARALALDPTVLLMDEPFGALDPITRRQLQDDFLESDALASKTIVFVTHDIDEAFRMAGSVTIMRAGEAVQTGRPDELRDDPADDFVAAFVGGRDEPGGPT